jgi:hypothetical protein
VWTTPPIAGKARYSSKWVARSEEGRSVPSIIVPSRSVKHQIGGFQILVRHTAWLDGYEAALAVDPTGVAEGIEDEATTDEFEIGLQHGGSESFQAHNKSLQQMGPMCQKCLPVENILEEKLWTYKLLCGGPHKISSVASGATTYTNGSASMRK